MAKPLPERIRARLWLTDPVEFPNFELSFQTNMAFSSFRALLLTCAILASSAGTSLAEAVLADDVLQLKDLSGATIPEPTVFGLIGVVGFLLMLRRRR